MFIERECERRGPPSGGPCESWRLASHVDMALLTEGDGVSLGAINISLSLLAEGNSLLAEGKMSICDWLRNELSKLFTSRQPSQC